MSKTSNTRARMMARAIGRLLTAEQILRELTYFATADDLHRIILRMQEELKATPAGIKWIDV